MDNKKKSNESNSKALDNQEVLELLNKANKQYENYLKLSSLDYEDKSDNQYNLLKRDINHPLNIVLKYRFCLLDRYLFTNYKCKQMTSKRTLGWLEILMLHCRIFQNLETIETSCFMVLHFYKNQLHLKFYFRLLTKKSMGLCLLSTEWIVQKAWH